MCNHLSHSNIVSGNQTYQNMEYIYIGYCKIPTAELNAHSNICKRKKFKDYLNPIQNITTSLSSIFFSWHDYRKYTIAPITIKPKKKKEKIGTEIFRLCWEWKAELDFEAGGNISMWSFFSWVLKSIGNNRKILILLAYSSSISLICLSVPVSRPQWQGNSFFVLQHLSGRIFTL